MQPRKSEHLYFFACSPCCQGTPKNHDKDSRYRCLRSCFLADAENSSERSLTCFWLFRCYPIHEITRSLAPQNSQTLPVFCVFTGCDTESFFCWKKVKIVRGTRGMCFLTLSTHSWKSPVHSELTDLYTRNCSTTQEPSRDFLSKLGNNCFLKILVAWIEFLQLLL